MKTIMKTIEIKTNSNSINYRIIKRNDETDIKEISDFFPLPWGDYDIEAEISGSMYSSAGGAWYWQLPEFCIMGYGQYCPWVKFKFSGTIHVVSGVQRDFPHEYKWGWRQGDSKWVYLDGKLFPSKEYLVEKLCAKIIAQKSFKIMKKEEINKRSSGWEVYHQGHLTIRHHPSLSDEIMKDERLNKIRKNGFSRRKIYNHQIWGNVQVLYFSLGCWAIIAPEGGKIVSSDHLYEPINLIPGVTICEHPKPEDD